MDEGRSSVCEFRRSLLKRYHEALSKYPFGSSSEANALGLDVYRVVEREAYTALEIPYAMRSQRRKESRAVESVDNWESSSSSAESYDPNEPVYYDDIRLDIDLFHKGRQIVDDCQITLVRNVKYGFVGRNGVGKTTLIRALAKGKFGMPKGVQVHAIKQDYVSDEKVVDFVGADSGRVLAGLGFDRERQQKTLRELSGGWRMRAQLARAIHLSPALLLLDEPTNFLDIEAIAYLEKAVDELKTVVIVSHDRGFLNATTTRTLHLSDMKIEEFKGNYDAFISQREARRTAQARAYEEQCVERAHLQRFIDRFRYSAARAAQAQSRIKLLEKMEIVEPPPAEAQMRFSFKSTPVDGTLIELAGICFGYSAGSGDQGGLVFSGLNLRIKHNSRIVIVGANGEGKSTLFRLIAGLNTPTAGAITRHPGLRVGYFAQHHADHLSHSQHTLGLLTQAHSYEEAKRVLSVFGLPTANQQIGTLSGGQKSRLGFAKISLLEPNLLLLDEPTNHLDMETIDALAEALGGFAGAVVCVSHDLAFIEKVFDTVYVCAGGKLEKYHGTVGDYKRGIISSIKGI